MRSSNKPKPRKISLRKTAASRGKQSDKRTKPCRFTNPNDSSLDKKVYGAPWLEIAPGSQEYEWLRGRI